MAAVTFGSITALVNDVEWTAALWDWFPILGIIFAIGFICALNCTI